MADYVKLAGRVMDAFKLKKYRQAKKGLGALKGTENLVSINQMEDATRLGGLRQRDFEDFIPEGHGMPTFGEARSAIQTALKKKKKRGIAEGVGAWGGAGALAAGGGIGAAKLLKKDKS